MRGYKAFNKGWKCRDFQYEIGNTYELREDETLEICHCGFHFCKNPIDVFGYYSNDFLIAEVEALGDIQQEGTKYCTNKIKIVKELTKEQLKKLIVDDRYNTAKYNWGKCNSGEFNTGNYNSGSFNAGDYNAGCQNSGNNNTGDYNTGSLNTGNSNSGYSNNGFGNTGDRNLGDYNSGDDNSGDYNTGDYNKGNCNTGDCNSGSFNSGHFNFSDYNTGIFNTKEPKMRAFNKECDMTPTEFICSIDYDFPAMRYRIRAKRLLKKDVQRIKNLPNFDAKIFKEITGIEINEEGFKYE